MQERDLQAEQTLPRLLVDELDSFAGELVERGADVRHLVRDVMHPGAALGQELAHGRLLAKRSQQLDATRADLQGRGFDALVGNRLPVLDPSAEDPLVGRDGLVEVFDRDAEMMDPASLHAGDATRRSSGRRRSAGG